MRSLADIYHPLADVCDKNSVHSYVPVYEEILAPYRNRPDVHVLEIGIFKGGSLRMWEQYFAYGCVWGVDLCDQPLGLADLRPMIAEGTHNIALFNACSAEEVQQHFADMRFDVIIEDASHSLSQQMDLYATWRTRLAPGGLYVIEDIENLDRDRRHFKQIDPSRSVEILDRRHLKHRFDDVLVLIRDLPQ